MSAVFIAAINAQAPLSTIVILAAMVGVLWLVVAKQADLDDAADAAAKPKQSKIYCGTCKQSFDSLVEYNNHVYDLEHGNDPRDN